MIYTWFVWRCMNPDRSLGRLQAIGFTHQSKCHNTWSHFSPCSSERLELTYFCPPALYYFNLESLSITLSRFDQSGFDRWDRFISPRFVFYWFWLEDQFVRWWSALGWSVGLVCIRWAEKTQCVLALVCGVFGVSHDGHMMFWTLSKALKSPDSLDHMTVPFQTETVDLGYWRRPAMSLCMNAVFLCRTLPEVAVGANRC